MTMEVFLAAAALINLHHISVNLDEEWGREMKGLLFGADWESGSDVLGVCFSLS